MTDLKEKEPRKFIIGLDVETLGAYPWFNELLSVGMAVVDTGTGELVEKFRVSLKCSGQMDASAQKFWQQHKSVFDRLRAEAIDRKEGMKAVAQFLDKYDLLSDQVFIVTDSKFDYEFVDFALGMELKRYGLNHRFGDPARYRSVYDKYELITVLSRCVLDQKKADMYEKNPALFNPETKLMGEWAQQEDKAQEIERANYARHHTHLPDEDALAIALTVYEITRLNSQTIRFIAQ